jgi:hypothetical protein
VVDPLPSKCEVLSSNPSTANEKEKKGVDDLREYKLAKGGPRHNIQKTARFMK